VYRPGSRDSRARRVAQPAAGAARDGERERRVETDGARIAPGSAEQASAWAAWLLGLRSTKRSCFGKRGVDADMS